MPDSRRGWCFSFKHTCETGMETAVNAGGHGLSFLHGMDRGGRLAGIPVKSGDAGQERCHSDFFGQRGMGNLAYSNVGDTKRYWKGRNRFLDPVHGNRWLHFGKILCAVSKYPDAGSAAYHFQCLFPDADSYQPGCCDEHRDRFRFI